MKEIPYGQEDFYKEFYPEEFKEYEEQKISITRKEYNSLKEYSDLGKHHCIAYPNLLLVNVALDIIFFTYLLDIVKKVHFTVAESILTVTIITFISFLYTYLLKSSVCNIFKKKISSVFLISTAFIISVLIILF